MNEKAPSARELREKYQALLAENSNLREGITLLKARLGDEAVGSINLMSYGDAEESIMRLESPNIANELLKLAERTTVN